MPQTLEEAIGDLDSWVNFTRQGQHPNDKQIHPTGLTIHFSTGLKKWICGYGKAPNHKHCGIGNTPLEAVQDKIRKLETSTSA